MTEQGGHCTPGRGAGGLNIAPQGEGEGPGILSCVTSGRGNGVWSVTWL